MDDKRNTTERRFTWSSLAQRGPIPTASYPFLAGADEIETGGAPESSTAPSRARDESPEGTNPSGRPRQVRGSRPSLPRTATSPNDEGVSGPGRGGGRSANCPDQRVSEPEALRPGETLLPLDTQNSPECSPYPPVEEHVQQDDNPRRGNGKEDSWKTETRPSGVGDTLARPRIPVLLADASFAQRSAASQPLGGCTLPGDRSATASNSMASEK